MKTCTARIAGVSPYSQSRGYDRFVPKLSDGKESADDYEKRTWREKCHYDDKRQIFIPGMSFKMSLDASAKFLGHKIKGKGNSTWTKHFLAGVLVLDHAPIDASVDDVEGEWLFVNSDGVRGSGKRVWKCFPLIRKWEVDVTYHVADDTITKGVFEEHLSEAGKFIGIGRFRPERGGYYGRYQPSNFRWS